VEKLARVEIPVNEGRGDGKRTKKDIFWRKLNRFHLT